jgi:hypothetical protein
MHELSNRYQTSYSACRIGSMYPIRFSDFRTKAPKLVLTAGSGDMVIDSSRHCPGQQHAFKHHWDTSMAVIWVETTPDFVAHKPLQRIAWTSAGAYYRGRRRGRRWRLGR